MKNLRKGKLIVLEGIDGTGKSTQAHRLGKWLSSLGYSSYVGFEPTNGKYGRILRESAQTGRLSLEKEIELFLADRKQHVQEVIEPKLENGEWVILDRYYFSTMAYQGIRGADPKKLRKENEKFAPIPDLVLWLDIPIDLAIERIGNRGKSNEFERKEMLEGCRNIFASIHEIWFERIDACGNEDEVAAKIAQSVQNHCF